jgi:uncharacterized protein (DUF433 family)
MTLTIKSEPLPLIMDKDDVIRIKGSRVSLDTVVTAFLEGATAEEIVLQYPSLQLADIYAVIGYYLRKRQIVDEYLEKRQQLSKEVRENSESRFDPNGIRNRLLSRQSKE